MRRQIRLSISFSIFLVFLIVCSCGKSHRGYRIGVDPSFFPLDIKGKEANIFAFSNEILKEISKIEKVRFERVNMSWDNLVWGLKEKKYDGILSSIYPYIFNKKKYSFSESYFLTGPVLVVKKNLQVHSLEEMAGMKVGVEARSDEAIILDQYPKVLPRDYLTVPSAFLELERGKIDGLLLGTVLAHAYVRDLYANSLKVATEPLNDEGLRLITTAESHPSLIKLFNEGLEKLKESGKYDELKNKWNLN